ncbi:MULTISPECIES: hypothetical protein [unclassified Streptomyces]|uniref:hypothetical protein n=1 Tax=unclassified Streptomyces TaxID=2593676 RepID=UPI000DC2C352|nr:MULTISPECIES: hypothetical protein [unclassified Streptomyces]RAJ74920.1 hypothetical protein K377_06687 [Streptomyces sp. PsTaAH-137]
MAGDGYKVDLSALDNVIKKVNGIIADLGKTSEDTRSKTYLPKTALGAGFGEATKLTAAHDDMKGSLEDVVRHLESVMDDFGAKTKRAHGAYQDAEADTAGALHGASTGSSSSTVPTSNPGSMA